ncbi:MAG: hypothetical protein M1839_004010 [Geoglossum umbratile]|nr:MAG: hypothetical protein M1839_004010 [Geoglossum umbratile]
MARAISMLCSIYATVMTKDPKNIPQTGVWGRIELPTLQLTGNPGGQVDTVVAVNAQGGDLTDVWIRPGTARINNPPHSTPSENGNKAQPNECHTPDELQGFFGNVDW